MSLLLNRASTTPHQAGFVALDDLRRPWVERFMLHADRTIPVVRTKLQQSDRWGTLKVRWGIGRICYKVLPGLYAAGSPGSDSPVFVTGNYKMSFDALRSNLEGLNAWILSLDTKGINVWCAAGKGSFGTDELVSRIMNVKLAAIVTHRVLILPQLGASGISAPEVARRSGFRVQWGPVRARDIPAWLAGGRVKTDAMREVTFTLRERMAIAPVELVHAWPVIPLALVMAALYALPANEAWRGRAFPAAIILLGILPIGTLLFPALIPWLPTKAFSAKGAFLGACWATLGSLLFHLPFLAALGAIFIATPVVAFLGMNFTGSTTFTCQPGALIEVEKSFWPMSASLSMGLILAIVSRLLGI